MCRRTSESSALCARRVVRIQRLPVAKPSLLIYQSRYVARQRSAIQYLLGQTAPQFDWREVVDRYAKSMNVEDRDQPQLLVWQCDEVRDFARELLRQTRAKSCY